MIFLDVGLYFGEEVVGLKFKAVRPLAEFNNS